MTNNTTHWRQIGFVGACFIFGSLCWSIFSNVGGSSKPALSDDSKYADINVPKSHFSPAEVVTLQVQSIRDSVETPEQLTVCYSLASPNNRALTGPFANFSQMVMMPPYDRLAICDDWQVGSATIEKDYAAVLVSTVSKDGDATAFRFVLHRYEEAPYMGCWLTEAVQVLQPVRTQVENGGRERKESLLD